MTQPASHPWIQTASGGAVDLVTPVASSIEPRDVAEHLSKVARYNGATPGTVLSVAQHSVIVADEAYSRSSSRVVGMAALLHDGHEFALGDDTSPKKKAMVEMARELFGDRGADMMRAVQRELQARMDEAIYRRFGVPWPLPADVARLIHAIDMAVLETERRDLMAAAPRPWTPTGFRALELVTVRPGDRGYAREQFINRVAAYSEGRVDV